MQQSYRRRSVLKGTMALAVGFLSGCGTSAPRSNEPLMSFSPVRLGAWDKNGITLSDDYEYQVLIPWGSPLVPGGPAFVHPQTADNQLEQVGIGHDGMTFFPLDKTGRRGLLAVNNEYGRNRHVLGTDKPESLAQVRASQHAHGMTVVEIEQKAGQWVTVDSPYARRIHANTEMRFSGPVAGHKTIKNPANNPVKGTLSNCSNGATPWGTYLTCEENFNLYFGATGEFTANESQQRYGFFSSGAGYDWHRFDPRFDLSNADYANEGNRFGWVVEIDPRNPGEKPVKRSALGRFKHEGAAVVEGKDGRVVVYMGDDQRFEFIYKFVSRDNWRQMRRDGVSPLDEGTLYVARFDAGGSGEWLPLTLDQPELASRFSDEAELMVNVRLAATMLGATQMDRPEWTTVAPDGEVYCTLTNNDERTVANAANPFAPNPNGHIIRWKDDNQHLGTRFTWNHFLLADDVYASEDSFGSPDGLWADPDGRLFICTDGAQSKGMPNQLLVADTHTKAISRLLVGVPKCEITGITSTPDRRTLFVNVQHPGNGDPLLTNFPAAFDGVTVPRDCTLALRRKDGGIVGS